MTGRDSIKKLRGIFRFFGIIIVLVIFLYLGKNIVINWTRIAPIIKNINPWFYALSMLLLFIAQIYVVLLWRTIANTGTNKLTVADAVSIFYLSALGRYMPGKVWQLVGLAYLSEGAGVESEIAITASLLSQTLSVVSGIFVSAGMVVLYIRWYFVLPLIVLSLIFLYPDVFNKILDFFSRKLRGKSLKMNITFTREIVLFFGYIVAWMMYGLSLYYIFRAFSLEVGLFESVQFFAVSYLLGLFAIFVPGGLGVREGILTVLLKKAGIIGYIGSVIAIVERLNITVTELILGLFGLLKILLKRKS